MADSETSGGVKTRSRDSAKTEQPKLFKVMLLNDDYTTMDFVVTILESVFGKPPAEAVPIMLRVHNEGRGVCGVYPKQIAETKIEIVHQRARVAGYPLRCAMEEV